MNELFEEAFSQSQYNVPTPQSVHCGENAIKNIESEFTGAETAYSSRKKEYESLKKEKSSIEIKLKQAKNPNTNGMNPKKREVITKTANDYRKKLRIRLAQIEVLLDELDIETGVPMNTKKEEPKKNDHKIKKKDIKSNKKEEITINIIDKKNTTEDQIFNDFDQIFNDFDQIYKDKSVNLYDNPYSDMF